MRFAEHNTEGMDMVQWVHNCKDSQICAKKHVFPTTSANMTMTFHSSEHDFFYRMIQTGIEIALVFIFRKFKIEFKIFVHGFSSFFFDQPISLLLIFLSDSTPTL